MYEDTRFGSICEGDFLEGSLKDDYLTIRGSLIKASETCQRSSKSAVF
jgi:hypothetical protein